MQSLDLKATAVEFAANHPDFVCTARADAAKNDLLISLHPRHLPDRVAEIRVLDGAEVFDWSFAGHEVAGFAYEDGDRVPLLLELLEAALVATSGPTTVEVRRRGGQVVGTRLHGTRSELLPFDTTVSYTRWSIRAFRDRRGSSELIEFPASEPG